MNKEISILFVEDNQDDFELILRELKKNHFNVTSERVEEAASLKRALESKWDLILSDYKLPNFSGEEALKICRSLNADVPFILISGSVGEDLVIDLLRSGASDFVLKDRMSRLIPAINREIAHYHEKLKNIENEKKLNVSIEQVRHLQKLEAMGLLASGIAHDFNNILAAMLLYFSQLKNSQEETTRNYAEKLIQVHSRAVSLTKQILSFSRRNPNVTVSQNINKSVEEIQDMLSRLLTSRITVDVDLEPELGLINANKGQIDQIIMNLAVNARDAMKGAGRLVISTKNVYFDQPQKMTSGTLRPGNYIMLSILDSGSGIEQNVIERIFEPFFTTKNPEAGSGLGLSIVHGIVKSMQGEILVTSEVGKQTMFSVYLPKYANSIVEQSKEKVI